MTGHSALIRPLELKKFRITGNDFPVPVAVTDLRFPFDDFGRLRAAPWYQPGHRFQIHRTGGRDGSFS